MELWDLLDQNGNPLGRTLVRGEVLPQGTYHRTVDIYTVNSRGELLTTLRAPEKDMYPNLWEVTGGSAVAGEASLTAAMRELREETGLTAEAQEMVYLMTHCGRTTICDVYLFRRNAAIADLTMQVGETVAARWVSFDEWERMIDAGDVPAPVGRLYEVAKPRLWEELGKR